MTDSQVQLSSDCRRLLTSLCQGGRVTERAFYQNSLALSDYSVLCTSNAHQLADLPMMDDFALPGALYMIRHGLELWMKCILANRGIDRLLGAVVQHDIGFEDLCRLDELELNKANSSSLRLALCVMKNVLRDGLRFPECRMRRISNRGADEALSYLREHPELPRSRVADLFVPAIRGHGLKDLWEKASPYVCDLQRGTRQFVESCGGGDPLDPEFLRSLCELLNYLDPDGDALRYPFSLRGRWHARELRMSLAAVSDLALALTESTRSYTSYRREVYTLTTVSDPCGPLYFGWES